MGLAGNSLSSPPGVLTSLQAQASSLWLAVQKGKELSCGLSPPGYPAPLCFYLCLSLITDIGTQRRIWIGSA